MGRDVPCVGLDVGVLLGSKLGTYVGTKEGTMDGQAVGATVSFVVGDNVCPKAVGGTLGTMEGAEDGDAEVGWDVGVKEGDNGEYVGDKEGTGDGGRVGYDTGERVRLARELLARVSYST